MRGVEPVSVPAGTCADPEWGDPLPGPVLIDERGLPMTEWAIAPYCTCRGVPGDRWVKRDDDSDLFVAGCCGRTSREVWEAKRRIGEGVPQPDQAADFFGAQATGPDTVAEQAGAGTPDEKGNPRMKISNSELRAFKRCRRKWWLAYYRKLRLRKDGVGPLSVGNMVHCPLELYYADPQRDPETFDWETPLAAHVEARLASPDFPEQLHEQMLADYELVKIMLRGYFEWLAEEGADSEIEIIAAEREIEAFMGVIEGEEVWLMGKLDAEAKLRSDGRRVFVDHKSVQTMSDLPKTGPLDEQLKTYGLLQRLEAVAENDLERTFATGGVWNMLRKVKRTARSNPPYYGRASVSHNVEVYRNFQRRVWGEVRDIIVVRRALDAGGDHQVEAYANPTRDCSWDCAFFLVCGQFDDGSDVESVVQTEYTVHDPYERYTEMEKA